MQHSTGKAQSRISANLPISKSCCATRRERTISHKSSLCEHGRRRETGDNGKCTLDRKRSGPAHRAGRTGRDDRNDNAARSGAAAGRDVVLPQLLPGSFPRLGKAGKCRVVNIASTDAKRYRSGVSIGCSMTRHALLAMNQAVRFSGWNDDARATAPCPGAIATDLVAGIPGATPKAGRLQPDTVADIVAFPMSLPNQASVPEAIANTRLESPI